MMIINVNYFATPSKKNNKTRLKIFIVCKYFVEVELLFILELISFEKFLKVSMKVYLFYLASVFTKLVNFYTLGYLISMGRSGKTRA